MSTNPATSTNTAVLAHHIAKTIVGDKVWADVEKPITPAVRTHIKGDLVKDEDKVYLNWEFALFARSICPSISAWDKDEAGELDFAVPIAQEFPQLNAYITGIGEFDQAYFNELFVQLKKELICVLDENTQKDVDTSVKTAYSQYVMNPSQEHARALRKAINQAGIEKQPVDERLIARMFEFVFLALSKINAKTNIDGIYKINGAHVQPTVEQMLQALQKELGKSRYEITAICTPAVKYHRYKLGDNSHEEDVVAKTQ